MQNAGGMLFRIDRDNRETQRGASPEKPLILEYIMVMRMTRI